MKTAEFRLPAYWASYFINADETGYEDDELRQIKTWELNYALGPCLSVDEVVEITRSGDDGGLLCERSIYSFLVPET